MSDKIEEISLKPCPLCGGEAKIESYGGGVNGGGYDGVKCQDCFCKVSTGSWINNRLNICVEQWNYRK